MTKYMKEERNAIAAFIDLGLILKQAMGLLPGRSWFERKTGEFSESSLVGI